MFCGNTENIGNNNDWEDVEINEIKTPKTLMLILKSI